MSDLPTQVEIHEEGPREGFQIEPGPISTADKIKLIEALAETGLHHIQAASFVIPAHAEIQRPRILAVAPCSLPGASLDPRFRGGDELAEAVLRNSFPRFWLRLQPVKPRCGAGKEFGLFRCRGAAGEPLERVEQHRIAAGTLVDREVAFEHAAAGAEILDTRFDIGSPRIGHLARRWRQWRQNENRKR